LAFAVNGLGFCADAAVGAAINANSTRALASFVIFFLLGIDKS
jgi:hypothetical protein